VSQQDVCGGLQAGAVRLPVDADVARKTTTLEDVFGGLQEGAARGQGQDQSRVTNIFN